ncbi:MAG: S8 family peptidase, partial [Ardenticatenales bacterium]|nr:S8 family peptidase [Ardenticatenales bacterium]
MGGTVLKPLAIINGVSAEVPASAIRRLERAGLMVTPNHAVRASAEPKETGTNGFTLYPSAAVRAHTLLHQGVQGSGVTVAFVDSGFPPLASEREWNGPRIDKQTLHAEANGRFIIYRDLFHPGTGSPLKNSSDPYGHGTHVVMTVADNRLERPVPAFAQIPVGVAPRSNIVVVRALDENGHGSYARVIEAIDWIVANRATYNIRVLNLSLDGSVVVPYWKDPLAQAVMRAWAEGIVVVASAGNQGPAPMTIGVPGNVPYVITVGAIKSGRYTTSGYDELATYSSTGPTESKFVKPDVLVPGSRTIAVLPTASTLAASASAALLKDNGTPVLGTASLDAQALAYHQVSGTSMAAAEVSGIVALLLEQQPYLTNNQVKYRLTSTATPAGNATDAQYSIWQQGAGLVDTVAAVTGISYQSANSGMDIQLDLRGEELGAVHYLGTTAYDPSTQSFYFTNQPIGSGSYQSWAGDYQSWAGDYQS